VGEMEAVRVAFYRFWRAGKESERRGLWGKLLNG